MRTKTRPTRHATLYHSQAHEHAEAIYLADQATIRALTDRVQVLEHTVRVLAEWCASIWRTDPRRR